MASDMTDDQADGILWLYFVNAEAKREKRTQAQIDALQTKLARQRIRFILNKLTRRK